MTEPRRIGNRRKFKLTNHRLSKQSYLQTIEQLEQALITQNTLLFGRGPLGKPMGGCVSAWQWTRTGTSIINFPAAGELAFNDEAGTVKVVKYDPTSPAQAATSIDLTGFEGTPLWLWWKRGESETTVRTEAHWVVPIGEQLEPTETILSERVDFGFSAIATPHATYNHDNGWRVFAQVGWFLGAAGVVFVPFIDSAWSGYPSSRGLTLPSGRNLRDPTFAPAWPFDHSDGIVYSMKRIIDQLWMLRDSDNEIEPDGDVASQGVETTWYHHPKYGTKQIDDNLDFLLENSGKGVAAIVTVFFDEDNLWKFRDTSRDYFAPGFLAATPGLFTHEPTVEKGVGLTLSWAPSWIVNGFAVLPAVSDVIGALVNTTLRLQPQSAVDTTFPRPGGTGPYMFSAICRFLQFTAPPYIIGGTHDLTFVIYGYRG